MDQLTLFRGSVRERRRESSCYVCHGNRLLCTESVCPIRLKAKVLHDLNKAIGSRSLFGSSPPGVFVGQRGYPRVSAGPLVPPVAHADTSIMDTPELWLNKSFDELLTYRLSLIRGRTSLEVRAARSPPRLLSTIQEVVMSSAPVDTEVWFKRRPKLGVLISPREAPTGPAGAMTNLILAENPKVLRPVEYVVSDTALMAESAVLRLYDFKVAQRQITRMFSVGLFGIQNRRRLVPTEWSITAVDDILGKALRHEILEYPQINEYIVFGHRALANNVQVLLIPSAWMFEALEAWLFSSSPLPYSDYELTMGRRTYPTQLVGAYHASRLPVLEYLKRIGRQAGAIVFLEVSRDWIPLGVWRFREICREALRRAPVKLNTLEDSLLVLAKRLELPIQSWVRRSRLLGYHRAQQKLEKFIIRE